MKLGLFGGTFDPIHFAHLILADEAFDQLDLDQVKFILTPDPPHKDDNIILPVEYRLEMLSAAIQDDPRFELSRVDLDRPPPHYAVDSVRLIKQEHPKDHICYLMGSDSLHELDTWHEALAFTQLCDCIGVMRRPGICINFSKLEIDIPGIQNKIEFIQAPVIEISGSKIRNNIKNQGPYRYYVPYSVYRVIEKHRLYR